MNRNSQAHFAQIPSMDISRSKFDRSFIHKTTCNTGELVPIYVDPDIVPGDTVTMKMSDLIRMTTPVCPVMDELKADFYFFFIPNRLTMANFKRFMGENDTAPWVQTTDYYIPQLQIDNTYAESSKLVNTVIKGSVLDHMGIPTQYWWKKKGTDSEPQRTLSISALPTRAYCLVWNEFFRSEALQNPVNVPTNDTTVSVWNANHQAYVNNPGASQVTYASTGGLPCLPVCKTFDYFTAALPSPQAGPDVTLPMNGTAPIKTKEFKLEYNDEEYNYGTNTGKLYMDPNNLDQIPKMYTDPEATGTGSTSWGPSDTSIAGYGEMYADLTQATGATINQLRTAFAIQKWQEREARGGWVA